MFISPAESTSPALWQAKALTSGLLSHSDTLPSLELHLAVLIIHPLYRQLVRLPRAQT